MTPLKEKLAKQIKLRGAIGVDQFMQSCLSDRDFGYYQINEPFGVEGDFTTAPEISQLFGEIIAIWLIQAWQKLEKPQYFNLCEMGPGRGTLMDDILRTISKITPQMLASAQINLIETSERLIEQQKAKLVRHNCTIYWRQDLDDLPRLPLLFVANELFDALPINQYMFKRGHFHKRLIGLDFNDSLCFVLGRQIKRKIPCDLKKFKDDDIVETSFYRKSLMRKLAGYISSNTGAALIIDYGAANEAWGDSLQAVSKHEFQHVLAAPSRADLSSHVDFSALKKIASRYGCFESLVTQRQFLVQHGLLERAGVLGFKKPQALQQQIKKDVERLAGADHMGDLFKVLSLIKTP